MARLSMVRKITETEGYRAIIQKGVLREVIMRRRRNELTIGQRTFETRNAANRFFEDLLYNQPLKVIVQEPHHAFLSALISRHPRAEQIVGKGIDHFTVENSVRGRRCFCMTRVDGTKTDFSFFECVRGSE